MRAPAHPTSFLSPDSIVVLELSIGQSLVLSLCLDGGWLDLTESAQRGRSDDAPPHTHTQLLRSRRQALPPAGSHPSAAGAETTRHSPSLCEWALTVPGRGRHAVIRFRCCLRPQSNTPSGRATVPVR